MAGRELAYKNINELDTLAAGSVDAVNDFTPVFDASQGKVVKVLASGGGAQAVRCTTQTDYTSNVTLANVTGLTANVLAGNSYAFRAHLSVTSNASGGVRVAIAGTATATSISYSAISFAGTTVSAVSTATSLGTAAGVATAAVTNVIIEGTIVVNAAGTLTVQAAQGTSFGTATSILVNSNFVLWRI